MSVEAPSIEVPVVPLILDEGMGSRIAPNGREQFVLVRYLKGHFPELGHPVWGWQGQETLVINVIAEQKEQDPSIYRICSWCHPFGSRYRRPLELAGVKLSDTACREHYEEIMGRPPKEEDTLRKVA